MKATTRSANGFLAAAATMAGGHAAYAEIVHFTNPAPGETGHYDWHWEQVEGWQSWLNITLAADQQTNTINGNSVGQTFGYVEMSFPCHHCPPYLTGNTLLPANLTGTGADIKAYGGYFDGAWALALQFGTEVNGYSAGWYSNAVVAALYGAVALSPFSSGQRRYIGVRTQSGNYGWIAVERNGMNFTAFAWAYETEPGVPIYAGQVPAPGTLALLAFGAILAPSRKRKSS